MCFLFFCLEYVNQAAFCALFLLLSLRFFFLFFVCGRALANPADMVDADEMKDRQTEYGLVWGVWGV